MNLHQLVTPKFFVLYIYVASALYVHFRGKVKHKFTRQLTDHSTFMAPYNALIYLFSAVPNKPILDQKDFPELSILRANWQKIREEARTLYDEGHIRMAENYNDLAFNTFFKRGWKRFYLKWYDEMMPSAEQLCPETVKLVKSIPSINAALFAMLPPHGKLGEHRDPFAGSMRYHLGLMTPNSDKCRIYIDGTPYAWRDGEDVLFDETYIHSVDNDTDEKRIILFCDVARPVHSPMRQINRFVTNHIVKATATQNVDTEPVGVLNRIARHIFSLKTLFQRMKKWNRKIYYTVKYAAILAIVYAIFIASFIHRH